MWVVATAFAAPAAQTGWIGDIALGSGPERVTAVVGRAGAQVVELDYRDPGAFARALLDAPSLLAQLHQAGVEPGWFDGLPDSGPRFVVASDDEARASYVFVRGRLQAMALSLSAAAVAPAADPFRRDRLDPLTQTLGALCGSLRPIGRDDYGNAVAWQGDRCAGGTLIARYDPREPGAALRVVAFERP